MSDPKRATLITVGAPKSAKNNVTKTVRLTINLDESNESKYPELNYKELVITEERKKRVENGKNTGLDPFSDNDDDVERVARKFEQKYGGKSTYGRRGRSKRDDFADIGAGYDENDSFIDNTHGYDEMIPPECDTLYGGFYINSGSLEFKTVPDEQQNSNSDGDQAGARRDRMKRRISSSSSEEESSESSSDSESQEEKDPKAIANGTVDSHKTEHRKKKNKKTDKKKANKVRRTDSSAATSGKQTSDDNAPADAESADSRTSQSDSLASKPAPSSENAVTSDSSGDVESKVEVKLPQPVCQALDDLDMFSRQHLASGSPIEELELKSDPYLLRVERALVKCGVSGRAQRSAWSRAARTLRISRHRTIQRLKNHINANATTVTPLQPPAPVVATPVAPPATTTIATAIATATNTTVATTVTTATNKRKCETDEDDLDISRLTADEKEAKIVEALRRLKALIDERKPSMMANYNAECERVQEERKKIQVASRAEGAPLVEKRLPKRRFPWCARSRALLARLARLAAPHAPRLLAQRALPLFPKGFVRMPTLLRQADLSKEMKAADAKRQRVNSVAQPQTNSVVQPQQYPDQIQFPSSLTVTTSVKAPEKHEVEDKDSKYKINPAVFGSIISSYTLNNDLVMEKADERKKEQTDKVKDDLYIPPNIGSITITPVLHQKDKKPVEKQKEPLLRVKSPAALNDMLSKKEKEKSRKPDKQKEKSSRVASPLQIDTGHQPVKKDLIASPKSKIEEVTQRQIETMRTAENNLPRPALVPVHHSPTFAKPDKRPPEVKKKKDVVIVSDLDPLGDLQTEEPLAVDDSSSDVELVEEKNGIPPPKERVQKKGNGVRLKELPTKDGKERRNDPIEEPTKEEIDTLMRNIMAMEHSQEPPKLNCNSYGGVITSAQSELL